MANFGIDFISQAMPKFIGQYETEPVVDTFFKDVLFGGPTINGDVHSDWIMYDWRKKSGTHLLEESLRGADPDRVNYQSNFNSRIISPFYFNKKDEVTLADGDHRLFGETITAPSTPHERVMRKFAEKIAALKQDMEATKEDMAETVLFDGKISNKQGEQAYPMAASLLNLNKGGAMSTDFEKAIQDIFIAARKINKAFNVRTIIFNPDDALKIVKGLNTQGLLNKESYNLATILPGYEGNGITRYGVVSTVMGDIRLCAYLGTKEDGSYVIPAGKAVMADGAIGSWAYGRLEYNNNGTPDYMVGEEKMLAYTGGEGDSVKYMVQYQTAPLPVITKIDGYAVITGVA